jgi:TPR repeat protein
MYLWGRGVTHDLAEATKWFRKEAEQGDAAAESRLGLTLHFMMHDQTEALKWFRKAAEQGDAIGQSCLGEAYAKGDGVPQDYVEAVKLFRQAAEQGDSGGQYNLGVAYRDTQGVPQDYVLAHMWFNLAAARGYQIAQQERDRLAEKMTPTQIAEAQRLAREWKPTK